MAFRGEERPHESKRLRRRIHQVVFEADTPGGKAFDIALLWAIGSSVLIVVLDSVEHIHAQYGASLYAAEWAFTVCFTVEYALRIYSVRKPLLYPKNGG